MFWIGYVSIQLGKKTPNTKLVPFPLNMYETRNPIGERMQFHEASIDSVDALIVFDEVDEGQDEYSDKSCSSDTEESGSSGEG